MNKNELISAMAKTGGLTKVDAAKGLTAFVNVLSDTLKVKDSITLVGFGTFKVAHRKAKEGRNPRTGEKLRIAAKDVPVFKAGKGLKEKIK